MIMLVKFIRNDKEQLVFGGSISDEADWGITEIDGLGTVENDIKTEKCALGDGDVVTAERIESRHIDITANVKDKNCNEIEYSKALHFFNPKYTFEIHIYKDESKKWINSRIEAVKFKNKQAGLPVELKISFICVDPYFKSENNYGKNIAAISGLYVFPAVSVKEKGFLVGLNHFAKQVQVNNTGDTKTYCTIAIKAKGVVINPKVMIGESYIKVLTKLNENDVIQIDMVNGKIDLNNHNCFRLLDRRSSFSDMVLNIGDNVVSFAADSGDINMDVMLYYNLQYLGV